MLFPVARVLQNPVGYLNNWFCYLHYPPRPLLMHIQTNSDLYKHFSKKPECYLISHKTIHAHPSAHMCPLDLDQSIVGGKLVNRLHRQKGRKIGERSWLLSEKYAQTSHDYHSGEFIQPKSKHRRWLGLTPLQFLFTVPCSTLRRGEWGWQKVHHHGPQRAGLAAAASG